VGSPPGVGATSGTGPLPEEGARTEEGAPEVGPELEKDQVDVLAEFWLRENPDFDLKVKTLAMRLRRGAQYLERALRQELAKADIELWEFEVLLALRRCPEYRRSAGELLKESHVTSGAITNRVARLEQRGWVRRDVDPKDRRHVLVTLTPAGRARADQLLATKIQSDEALFSRLDPEVRDSLNDNLRKLLISIEGHAEQPTW
jgi:DNA-binding MarR family transcriptional regulator